MDHLRKPLEDWIRAGRGPADVSVEAITPFAGGASNITCLVELSGANEPAVVLRLQRTEGIFAPYDVLREGRVLAALTHAPFPVPAVLASEPDSAVLGAPFLLLEYIESLHMGEPGVEADFREYVGAVVAIHSLDWRRAGLEFLGVPARAADGLQAELTSVVDRMARFHCDGDPLLATAAAALAAAIPEDGDVCLCQGDINVFNYLFRGGRLVGVVDWEQARLSDPRGDVGQIIALSHLKGAPFCPPREVGFVFAYEDNAGRELTGLEWFRAFWLFQLAVIHEGWVAFNDSLPWYGRSECDALLERALVEIG
ncbi:MAG: phosphotransferase family protein [Dehalococcoidia bacterium]